MKEKDYNDFIPNEEDYFDVNQQNNEKNYNNKKRIVYSKPFNKENPY